MGQPTGNGYAVDPEQLERARDTFARIHRRTVDIIRLAEDANPEWYIWGLVGAPFAAWYWQYADDVYRHLDLMGEALNERVQFLSESAEAYQGAEKAMAEALKAIEDLLG